MAESFDPYITWLSIPRDKRPINYYQLLGLKEFTDDPDVIENSVNRQTAHVKRFLDGAHAADAKSILEQLDKAKVCLLIPDRKATYDKGLRLKLGGDKPVEKLADGPKTAKPLPKAAPAKKPAAKPVEAIPAEPGLVVAPRARQSRKSSLPKIAIAVAVLAVGGALLAVKFWPRGNEPSNETPPGKQVAADNTAPSGDNDSPPDNALDDPPNETRDADNTGDATEDRVFEENQQSQSAPDDTDPDSPQLDDGDIAGTPDTDDASNNNEVAVSDTDEQDPAPMPQDTDDPPMPEVVEDDRLPVPDESAIAEAAKVVKDIYVDELAEAANDAEKAVASAKSMVDAGRATKNDVAGRYMLFRMATTLAVEAGDLDFALRTVDQLDADFQVEAWPMRVEIVEAAVKTVKGREVMQAAADEMMALAERALAESEFEHAEALSDSALGMARRLRGETELVKSIAAFQKVIDERAKIARAVETALATLKDEPDNAAAHLTAGQYYSFVEGDWQRGLPHLTKGSDEDLRALAEAELAAPADEDDILGLADAWWDFSETADKVIEGPVLARARHWYEEALPLAKALNKIKAERRLAEIAERAQDAVGGSPSRVASSRGLDVKQVVYLDDIRELNSSVHWGALGKHGQTGFNREADGSVTSMVTFRGKRPPHSLTTHPPANGSSFVEYDIGSRFHLLTGIAGFIDKRANESRRTDLTFRVIGDGKLLWRSWTLRIDGQHFRVNVSGVRRLRLQVDCPGIASKAWATWIMPRLVEFKSQPHGDEIFTGVHPTLHYPLKVHPQGATEFNSHWYAFVPDEDAQWHESQRWCEEHGGYLVCLETAAEAEFVARLASGTWTWLGGVKYDDSGWSWINGSEMAYTRWAPNEPNNQLGSENKMNMKPGGSWNDAAHYSGWAKGFVCEWEK